MIADKRVLAVVPARGGSKGVPLKNIRPVRGVPLVAMVADVARQVPEIDRIVVSTDHPEIARIAREAGIDAPFTRPVELSGDIIADWDVLVHALLEMEKLDGLRYDIVVMLQPTSPMRKPEHISGIVKLLESGNLDSVWTVSETDLKSHPLKQLTVADGRLDYFDARGHGIIARQQLTKVYHRNGVGYAMTRGCLLDQKKIMGAKAGALIIEGPLVNIDTLEDFKALDGLLADTPRAQAAPVPEKPLACSICGSAVTQAMYHGPIRMGRFGNLSQRDLTVWKCPGCLAGFLPNTLGQSAAYYESKEYREEVDESADPAHYFRLHDAEQVANLEVIGTATFRGKIAADVGCGGGSFLDGIRGYAQKAIAIEPSQAFRDSLTARGYPAYRYAKEAAADFGGKLDIVTSFSVLEHVEDPLGFVKDMRARLAPGGRLILSTPNSDDVLMGALPDEYPRFFFRKAHLWYFNPESLERLLTIAGFPQVRIIPRHRFGLSNFLAWMRERAPKGHTRFDFVTSALDATWKAELERTGRCDYLYAEARLGA